LIKYRISSEYLLELFEVDLSVFALIEIVEEFLYQHFAELAVYGPDYVLKFRYINFC
jgi:hypothetical protein